MLTIKDIFSNFAQREKSFEEDPFEVIGGTEKFSDNFLQKIDQAIEFAKRNPDAKLSSPINSPEHGLVETCQFCPASFRNKGHLTLHLKAKHPQEVPDLPKPKKNRRSAPLSYYAARQKRKETEKRKVC